MKLLKLFSLIAILAIATSCSSNDETNDISGPKEITDRFKSLFLNDKGEVALVAIEEGKSEFVSPCESKTQASELCRSLLKDIDNKDSGNRYILPDGHGYVKVTEGEREGIYMTMVFNVKDMPAFTLHLTSDEFFENLDNGRTPARIWLCTGCKKQVVSSTRPGPCCSRGNWLVMDKSGIPGYAFNLLKCSHSIFRNNILASYIS